MSFISSAEGLNLEVKLAQRYVTLAASVLTLGI